MEPMTQDRLCRYIGLKIQSENYTERLARMKSRELFPPMRENDGSQRQPGGGDRMGGAIAHRMEVEDVLADKIDANRLEMRKIEAAINSLEPMEAEVLWARYIDDNDGKRRTWEDIAESIYKDADKVRTVTRIHDRAIENIERVVI